jgi:hypothetical protein
MKRLVWVGIAVTSMLAAGCGENQSPSATVDRVAPSAAASVGPAVQATSAAPVAESPSAARVISAPVPPAGAQWTIFCTSWSGPDHVLISNQAKQDLLNQSRLPDWYIVHHDDESILYYGYYTAYNTPRAKADKHSVDALTGANGDRAFPTSMFVPLSSPDPAAPPEWNLSNTPPDMYWSLQIGAFCQTPDRKERAVAAVREARKDGYEAYYYHGEAISSVCIGAWPKTAVRQQDGGAVAHNDDPNKPVMVQNFPRANDAPKVLDDQGQPIPVLAPELVIDDPTLAKVIAQFPDHAVNGATMVTYDKNKNPVPSPSFLVIIQHGKSAGHDPDDADSPQQGVAPATPAPADDNDDSTLGKLRTIGDH